MNYSVIYKDTISDGPGFRVSLYISGCRNHCKGCHNPETWDFNFGKPFTKDTWEEIFDAVSKPYIKGLTIAGGEPFEEENQKELLPFLCEFSRRFSPKEKDIWVYTGYEFKDLIDVEPDKSKNKKYIENVTICLLGLIDVLVAGPFILEQRDISDANRWRGSKNQRVIDVTKTLLSPDCKLVYVEGIPNND